MRAYSLRSKVAEIIFTLVKSLRERTQRCLGSFKPSLHSKYPFIIARVSWGNMPTFRRKLSLQLTASSSNETPDFNVLPLTTKDAYWKSIFF